MKEHSDITEAGKRKLRSASYVIFAIITLAFLVFSLIVIVSTRKYGFGWAFSEDSCAVYDIIGYLFLAQVIVMILLVVWLFIETQRAVNRERRASDVGGVTPSLRRERCTYAIISIFFGLSYIGRYILNSYGSNFDEPVLSPFALEMTGVIVWLFEGLSMGCLMLFHYVNFQEGSLFSSKEPEYASILPGEYHRFDTEEVNAHSSAEESS